MELKRRFDEKQPVHLEQPVVDDDQGKWEKGYGAGPGIGGRRGLPPRQRIPGWVRPFVLYLLVPFFSLFLTLTLRRRVSCRNTKNGYGQGSTLC